MSNDNELNEKLFHQDPYPGMEFKIYQDMVIFMNHYRVRSFPQEINNSLSKLAVNPKPFSLDQGHKIFGKNSNPTDWGYQRGFFYCAHKEVYLYFY